MKERQIRGVVVPSFFYGTAWKEEATEELTRAALDAGFRAIDTANQRRHYHEAGVGKAVQAALAAGTLTREALFLQTKYTFRPGQDHRLPYDPSADVATQVQQSFDSSLSHLGVDHVDSYILHGPSSGFGIGRADVEAWQAMESLQRAGKARLIGVSNMSVEQLAALYREAEVKPAFIQNRCFARNGWDAEVRAFCSEHDVVYQGFSLLTANGRALNAPAIQDAARRTARTVAQVVFRFVLQVGMIPLTGTTSAAHMAEDLDVYSFTLEDDEVAAIERVMG